MDLWLVFLTGLTTGGISCVAMQGGLLASVVANQKRKEHQDNQDTKQKTQSIFHRDNIMPVVMFLSAKLISHTILGFLLGALGSVLTLSFGVRITFQILAALFMLATALNLLNVHPIFRFVMFQPPKFMQRWVRSTSKANYLFAPATLGLFTIFIPCGVTQAMEVLAINSGSPAIGALTMFMFVLGTAPVFGLIGIVTAKLSGSMQLKFMKFAAILLIFMSLLGINGVLQAVDAPVSWQRIQLALFDESKEPVNLVTLSDPSQMNTENIQKVTINIENGGYSPKRFTVQSGIPVELTLKTEETYSCASSFTFKEFEIYELLDPTDSKTFTFTPQKKGKFVFACSMGMYTGVMEVI
ncbi:MAG: sulfite exporter TauE/SafE family protein [Patescibacteria group bacterium]|jgi:sulfite exporter TauE/SafE